MRMKLALSFLILISSSSYAQEVVKIYFKDSNSFPFCLKNGKGTDVILFKMVEKKIGIKFDIRPVPWDRCLIAMSTGETDGCFSGSYTGARAKLGHYPMKDGSVDTSKRLHYATFSIFTTPEKASKIKVNGYTIEGIDKKNETIGATRSYSIAKDLKELGYAVDDSASTSENNFSKLVSGRFQYFVNLSDEGRYFMQEPKYKNKVVEVTPPLVNKAYYLIFGKHFYQKKEKLANLIWNTIEEVRESSEYKKRKDSFIKLTKPQ